MQTEKKFWGRWKNRSALFSLVTLVTLFYLPLFNNIRFSVPGLDWYEAYPFPSFFRLSVFNYHQFPLRAPHFAGGYPLIGHPYDLSLSPVSLLVLLFGPIAAIKLSVFLIFLLSTICVYFLARQVLRHNFAGALFSALVFGFSSWGSCQYLQSSYAKLYIYFLPITLLFFIRALKDKRYIFLACLSIGMVVISGGSILIPLMLFLFLYACFSAFYVNAKTSPRFDIRPLKIFFIVTVATAAICMVKIMPMHSLVSRQEIKFAHFPFEHDYARISKTMISEARILNTAKLYDMLFVQGAYIVGSEGVTGDDYMQFYLGFFPVLCAIVFFAASGRKNFPFILLLVIFTLLSFGPYSKPDLFKALWRIHPGVHSIWRLDEYFTFPILFIIALGSGGVFVLFEKKKHGIIPAILIIIGVLSLNSMFWANRRFLYNQTLAAVPKKMVSFIDTRERNLVFQKDFFSVKIKDPSADPEHYQKDGFFYLQQNVGMADWLYTNLKIRSAVIPKYFITRGDYRHIFSSGKALTPNPGYSGEAFFLDNKNKARITYFSPNEIRIAVTLSAPGTLIINQNYHQYWHADQGRLFDHEGLLALAMDARGDRTVKLVYRPLDFYAGLAMSVVGIALTFYFCFCRNKRKEVPVDG